MALSLLDAGSIPTGHLKNISSNSAIDYTAPILAITSLSEDPRTFGNEDYVQKLMSFHNQNQIGEANALNDDAFGILSLIASGVGPEDNIIVDAKNYLLQNQNQDGGWGFSVSTPSDTNMTAAVIVSLIAAGTPNTHQALTEGTNYLSSAQNQDGGFPYDPNSSFSTDSDTASTAWVVWALHSLSIDPTTWNQGSNNPINFLENNQTLAGFFEYQPGFGEDAFSPNTTAYAVIALSGSSLPLKIIAQPSPSLPLYLFRIEGSTSTVCSGEAEGPTALDIVKNASSICNFTYNITDTDFGPYLTQIDDDTAEGLMGWMYAVNNQLPSVGAADYNLEDGDFILWHFGEFGWEPSENNTSRLDLSVTITEGNVQGTSTPPSSTVGFTLDSQSLNFGELKPGESSNQSFGVTNSGNSSINIEAIVAGDEVFKQNLELDNVMWSQFNSNLSVNESKNINAGLTVPESYSDQGQKQGAITIWATVE